MTVGVWNSTSKRTSSMNEEMANQSNQLNYYIINNYFNRQLVLIILTNI